MRKVKLKRPTLKTAHEFHHVGIYPSGSEGQYFTEEDHYREVVEIHEDLRAIVRMQFPRTQNLEYAILKAHLIIEHSIAQYVRSFAWRVDAKLTRFSFSQKLDIAYLLGFGSHSPTLIPTVELLNRVRNQVAHSFTIDKSLIDESLRINSANYSTYRPKNDRERIRGLRMMCAFVTGYVSGHSWGQYYNDQRRRKPKKNPR